MRIPALAAMVACAPGAPFLYADMVALPTRTTLQGMALATPSQHPAALPRALCRRAITTSEPSTSTAIDLGPTSTPVENDRVDYYQLLVNTDGAAGRRDLVLRVPASYFEGPAPQDADDCTVLDMPADASFLREPQEVPLPATAWGGIAGLMTVAGFGFLRRRRLRVY